MIDAKTTEKASYSLRKKFLAQWKMKAEMLGKRFILPLRFLNDRGLYEDWAVLTMDDLVELIDMAKKGEAKADDQLL